MTLGDSSSLKVPYDLRPAKQAERRMFLDLLATLNNAGPPIRDYHYVGFGSIFFYDHRMLHKEFGISKMTSIEGYEPIIKRCKFNLPFSNVKLFSGMSSDFIPSLNETEWYFIWLDYDFTINSIVCEDIMGSLSRLRPGSLFFLTLDTHLPPSLNGQGIRRIAQHFLNDLPNYASAGLKSADFTPERRTSTLLAIIRRCLNRGLMGRDGITFEPLINMTYADGHRMLTVGGIIVDKSIQEVLLRSPLNNLKFVRRDLSASPLDIPKFIFTKRELLSS